MSFKFRMHLADGMDLDDYVAARSHWSPGACCSDGRAEYRVSAVVPTNDLDNELYAAILEVEPV